MQKLKLITLFLGATLALASCSSRITPGGATSNPIGSKVGISERSVYFNIFLGHTDLGFEKAAKNGGISKIATYDYSVSTGFFTTTYRTIVTGE
jgi:hypothetical protein